MSPRSAGVPLAGSDAPPLVHHYTARGTALEIFKRKDDELLVSGPAGTGKSRACLEKLHAVCMRTADVRGLIVRKTATSLTNTALVTFREHVAKEALEVGDVVWFGGSGERPPGYIYANGSTINVGGMDKPDKIMSSEYDIVYVQESTELKEEDWDAISSRMRNGRISFQQIIADCNPSHPKHWLKQRCERGDTVMLNSRHEENPRYFDEHGHVTEEGRAYIGRLDKLTGVRKARLRDGLWVSAEGVIYEGWNEEIHHIDRFPIPWDWPRFWVIDFGFRHPFVCQWWAEDPDGRLYMYREIYMTGKLTEDHAQTILANVTRHTGRTDSEGRPRELGTKPLGLLQDIDDGLLRWTEPEPFDVICDHDAEDRATLEKYLGRATSAAHKTVLDGIQAVQARLRVGRDGKPGIALLRDSLVEEDLELKERLRPTRTADEFPAYVWDQKDGPNKKERPVKEFDDGMDTLRYIVADRDLGPGGPNVRWLD